MEKVSIGPTNNYCPQTLFVYGTFKDNGEPNFGLFCWVSYYWGDNLGVMAAICEDKMTRDRIRANGMFSMGLVTEDILPLADYLGNNSGYSECKMALPMGIEAGRVLNVPALADCPWTFELEVDKTFVDGAVDIYLCKIRNVLADALLNEELLTPMDKLNKLRPIRTVGGSYYSWNGDLIGNWGEPLKNLSGME